MSQSKINSFCLLYRVTRCEQGGQLCIKYSAVKIASWVVQPTLPGFTNGDWYFFLLIHYRIGPIAVDIFLETTTKEETEKPDSIHQPSDFRARKTILVPKILVTGRSRRNCCSTRIVKRTGQFKTLNNLVVGWLDFFRPSCRSWNAMHSWLLINV